MKSRIAVFMVALSMVMGSNLSNLQAAAKAKPSAGAPAKAAAVKPQLGGVFKIILKSRSVSFGYPPQIAGADKDFAPPFFDRLLSVGDDGKYKPGLALSWDTSKDGKVITFKLRQGVKFHDGTPFNAQAVKANLDQLIPPNPVLLAGISSVEAVDDYTVKLNLPSDNNLILYSLASNPACYLYSPEALKKNGADWAKIHPVGTGPFMLKDYQPNISLTLVKNPDYWQKGLPYLDGIEMSMVTDPMTQMITLKSGQAHAIFNAQTNALQLKNEGYSVQMAPGSFIYISFDTKNSEYFSKPKVRQAIEYAIDKEGICSGPGEGFYIPMYQIVAGTSPDYNKACAPRKYDPVKAKKLLAEAGYAKGFSFKMYFLDSAWKDGFVAIQSYLDKVGIKMELVTVNIAAFNMIRTGGKIEKGAASFATTPSPANTLYTLDTFWRSNSGAHQYIVKPAGIDKLIDQAKLAKDPAAVTKLNRQAMKLLYDDVTIVPLYIAPRAAVVASTVQNTGWFIDGDADNHELGTRTWLKK